MSFTYVERYDGGTTANCKIRLSSTVTGVDCNFGSDSWTLVMLVKITKDEFENCGGYVP